MGLAIAKGIVEAHGGRIWIEDGPDYVGSRVIVTLPVGDDDETIIEGVHGSSISEDERQAETHTYRR